LWCEAELLAAMEAAPNKRSYVRLAAILVSADAGVPEAVARARPTSAITFAATSLAQSVRPQAKASR